MCLLSVVVLAQTGTVKCKAWLKLQMDGIKSYSYVTYSCPKELGCTYLSDTSIPTALQDQPEALAHTPLRGQTMLEYYAWLWNAWQTFNVSGLKRQLRRTVCSAFEKQADCQQHCNVACYEQKDAAKLHFNVTYDNMNPPRTLESTLPSWWCPQKKVSPDVTPKPWIAWVLYLVGFFCGAIAVGVGIPVFFCSRGQWKWICEKKLKITSATGSQKEKVGQQLHGDKKAQENAPKGAAGAAASRIV